MEPLLRAKEARLRGEGRAACFSAQAVRGTAPALGRAEKREEPRWQLPCG